MKRRKTIFSPTQKLYSVTENVCGIKIKLFAGDIVVVLDDTSDSMLWIVRKADIIGRVHKKYLKPIDRTSIEVHYMNSKRQDHFSAQHQIESRLGPMPHYYEVLGYKVVETSGKYVTLFFILVKAQTMNTNPLRKNENSVEESWIVVKSQACFQRLITSLERYLGSGVVPCVPDIRDRKPTDWTVERWLQYRCDALQAFFNELRHPRRGLVFSPQSPTLHRHSLGSLQSVSVLDNPNVTLRSNYTPMNLYTDSAYNEDFSFDGIYSQTNQSNLYASHEEKSFYESSPLKKREPNWEKDIEKEKGVGSEKESGILEALVPLNIFLRTDKINLHILTATEGSEVGERTQITTGTHEEVVVRQINYDPKSTHPSHTDPAITDWKITINNLLIESFPQTPLLIQDYLDFLGEPGQSRPKSFPPFPDFVIEETKTHTDEELRHAVKSGNFEISIFTPISSLLRIWSTTSADNPNDHRSDPSQLNPYGFESEAVGLDPEHSSEEDEGEHIENEAKERDWSSTNFEQRRVRCTAYPSRAARASVTALGAEKRLNSLLLKYLEKPPRRNINRPSLVGLLLNDKQKSINISMEKYQHLISCMSEYLKDAKDSRSGLNAFAQFSLSSLIVSIKQHTADMESTNSSNKSLHDMTTHPSTSAHNMTKPISSQKKLVNSFYDTGSDSIIGLNEKINTLSLAWERRRMEALQREQDLLEGLVSSTQNSDQNEIKIKPCEYMSSLDQIVKPFPSQLNSLEPMTSSTLAKWLALRAKSRLSRKSDRVVKIERMQKLEQTFSKVRITIEQFVAIMDVIDQEDEKQHALYTLISRITDCFELESYNIWSPLTLNPDDEKKASMIIFALKSEAKAEQFYKKIFYLYELSLKHKKTGKVIATKIPKGFNTIHWKDLSDPASIPPKSKITELKQDIQTLRKLITECRGFVDEGASFVTDGAVEQTNAANYTLELKKLVSKSEAVSKLKGLLSAGKPEYLVHMKLKTSLMSTERARTLCAQAVDEIAATYTLLKRILSELEDALILLTEYAQYIQRKHLSLASNGSLGSIDGDEVGLFDADILEEIPHEKLGDSATGGISSGWRREMQEIFADNLYKFNKSCGGDLESDGSSSINQVSSNHIIDLTRMCILLSRIPLLRDTHTAVEEWNQRENEMNTPEENEYLDDVGDEIEEENEDDEESPHSQSIEGGEARKLQAAKLARRGGNVFDGSPMNELEEW